MAAVHIWFSVMSNQPHRIPCAVHTCDVNGPIAVGYIFSPFLARFIMGPSKNLENLARLGP